MVRIQEGRFYKTVQGHKIGPAVRNEEGTIYKWSLGGPWRYQDDGTAGNGIGEQQYYSAVAEWQDTPLTQGPIREVRKREIVPGSWGIVALYKSEVSGISIGIDEVNPTPEQLREAAHLFNQLAEVLEEHP